MPSIPLQSTSYGIVIDAGSSGSRVQIYSWPAPDKSSLTLPLIGKGGRDWQKKVSPGISSYSTHIADIGNVHLKPLLEHSKKIIPQQKHSRTPIYLLATAGMRLLPQETQQKMLRDTCTYILANSDFLLPDCESHIRVIDGKTEGLYGWLALNYLMGSLDSPKAHIHGKGHHTYGFLDMGGASAQVAFSPNATEAEKHMEDLYKVRLRTQSGESREFNIFVSTWLGYGANEAHRRYVESLVSDSRQPVAPVLSRRSSDHIILDPCALKGFEADDDPVLPEHTKFVGSGNLTECLAKTYPLLAKGMPCNDDPCLFGGVHAPAIDFDVNHFIGVSEYWHTTTSGLFGDILPAKNAKDDSAAGAGGAYDYATFSAKVQAYCSKDWSDVLSSSDTKDVDEDRLSLMCFKGSWVMNVLHSGFGVPRTSNAPGTGTEKLVHAAESKGFVDHFKSMDTVNGVELSWTLGKMVLYASSQVPLGTRGVASQLLNSSENAVGFGPNNGLFVPETVNSAASRGDSESWWEEYALGVSTFKSQGTLSRRRLPGLVLFVFIFVMMAYVIIGKVRRRKLTFTLTPKRYRRRVFGMRSGDSTPNMIASGMI
ncbi:nucleoside phosphatase family-domain-containing protein [Lipomyces arxii]|uniref:nucleoside phosphatase family-domain-containing protein n=1 Tax=Lipomyces arxii TaxID=56418 RepID=UPI0034CF4206